MRIALTGATGLVGRFLVGGLDGDVITLGRRADIAWDLTGPAPDLRGFDALVHAAFAHVPGRYRGGEGDDPDGFLRANLDGTRRLFDAAARDGVTKVLFLSSRAVFDGWPDDLPLTEDRAPRAASLYGQVKAQAEAHLLALPVQGIALRATGIYGPGPDHKWASLIRDFLSGRDVPPRRGTEVHGQDVATACNLLLDSDFSGAAHASDLLLDRHDLLAEIKTLTGSTSALPERSNKAVNPLICQTLPKLGWRPGGLARLRADAPALLQAALD